MKNKLLALLLIFSVFLTSCGYSKADLEAARQAGYNDGYYDGRTDTLSECEEAFAQGYDEGCSDTISDLDSIFAEVVEEIESDVRDKANCTVYEALQIVGVRHGHMRSDGTWDSYEEYLEAIDTLYFFADYFDSGLYEDIVKRLY